MFRPDYLLFNAYNETLWSNIKNEEQDFYSELNHFRKILKKLFRFCNIVKDKAIKGANMIPMLNSREKIVIAKSKWNEEFTWDFVDCMLAYVDKRVMRGLMIQRQHPQLCDNNDLLSDTHQLHHNKLVNDQFIMNSAFCDTNRLKYDIPQAVLASRGAYDLFA